MATNFLWGNVGTVINLLTTELNALANGTLSALGPEKGVANNYQMGQLYIHLASAAFVDPSYISIYLVPSSTTASGATYDAFHSAAAGNLANYLAATVYINGATQAQDIVFPYVSIPLGFFKAVALTGGSCPTLGATLNTVDLYPTPTQY